MPVQLPTYTKKGIPTPLYKSSFYGQPPSTGSGWTGILGYGFAILLVIIIILLLVNYTITPIFRMFPGGKGIIPMPGGDDGGKVYWQPGKKVPAILKDKDTNVAGIYQGWSFTLDFMIKNPMTGVTGNNPRLLFHRAGFPPDAPIPVAPIPVPTPTPGPPTPPTPSKNGTLLSVLSGYNVAIALLPNTTDMIVSVLNAKNNMENIILPNVPVQTPFRVGVIIMTNTMEVYMNGFLAKTRTMDAPPMTNVGNFTPPQGIDAELAKVGNLHLWPSEITSSQMRHASPSLMKVSAKDKSDIPNSSCSTKSIEKDIEDMFTTDESDAKTDAKADVNNM